MSSIESLWTDFLARQPAAPRERTSPSPMITVPNMDGTISAIPAMQAATDAANSLADAMNMADMSDPYANEVKCSFSEQRPPEPTAIEAWKD